MSKNKILIVDDNLYNLQITAKILKDKGYLISLAQNGKLALDLLSKQMPDLILLDVMMPELDGFETCKLIKSDSRFKEIPVIFLTAKTEIEDMVQGFNAGGVDYIVKPYNETELLVRVNTQLELANSRQKVLDMIKSRDMIYSIISHDIRGSLSSVELMFELIKNKQIDFQDINADEIVENLWAGIQKTLNLLDDLLNWAKVQNKSIKQEFRINNVNSLIKICVNYLEESAKAKNISFDLALDKKIAAFYDEATISTVFRNLISNAIKFTSENGKISISAKENNDYVEISIKDTGIGIPENIIKKIFNDNERYSSPGTKKEKGTGLGLIMVKDFVQKNNGQLKVNSTVGQGTEFIIHLMANKH